MELKRPRRTVADDAAIIFATWRRDVRGLLVFLLVFLLGFFIIVLIWNVEELQGLVRLLPAPESFKDGVSMEEKPVIEEINAGAGIIGADVKGKKEKKKKKQQQPENVNGIIIGGADLASRVRQVEPVVVDLTILTKAADIAAVCLDGSPPGYHLHKGSGTNANNWIVFLEGGAWCDSEENCKQRSKTNLGSSKFMKPHKFDGLLSNSEQIFSTGTVFF